MTFTFTAVVKATKFNFAACCTHAKYSFRVRLHTNNIFEIRCVATIFWRSLFYDNEKRGLSHFFLFNLTRPSHHNAWPGTASLHIPIYKNESPFVSLAKTQKRLDRFEYLFFAFVRFNTGVV
jgi:hypothetical protein